MSAESAAMTLVKIMLFCIGGNELGFGWWGCLVNVGGGKEELPGHVSLYPDLTERESSGRSRRRWKKQSKVCFRTDTPHTAADARTAGSKEVRYVSIFRAVAEADGSCPYVSACSYAVG